MLLVLLAAFACGGPGRPALSDAAVSDASEASAPASASASVAGGAPRLEIPRVPSMLADSLQMLYLATHWWDKLDYDDAAWLADTVALEAYFTPWAQALTQLPPSTGSSLARALIVRGDSVPAMQLRLLQAAEYFWRHPNSPFRNEELLLPVLEAVVASPAMDPLDKLRPQELLSRIRKNRPGMAAADLVYTTGSGAQQRLYATRADYTLVMFYEPGCPACGYVESHLPASEVFAPLLASGRLRVVALYPDEDLAAWRAQLDRMPRGWTVGHVLLPRDRAASPYDLPSLPSLYLLDRTKHVLLKDVRYDQLEAWVRAQDLAGRVGPLTAASLYGAAAAAPAASAAFAAPASASASASAAVSAAQAPSAAPSAEPAWLCTEHDFGTIPLGETRTTTFGLRAGSDPVVVLSAVTNCDCTQADVPRRPLAAGAEDAVTVRFTAKERGYFRKTLRVRLHVGGTERTSTLVVRGNVE